MTLQDLLTSRDLGKFQKLADSFCASVRATAKRRGKWVTGRSSSLLTCQVEVFGNNLQAVCGFGKKKPQFWQLQTGRKQGKMPPIEAIFQWSIDKRISFSTPKERLGFAWAVAKTIEKEGTQQYRTNNRLDVFDSQWVRFQRNFDQYVQMWVDTLLNEETNRINEILRNR